MEDQRKLNFHVLQPGFPTLSGDITKGYVMRLTSQQVADLAVAMSAAVRTYEKESAAAESDPANLGRQHYREQLARLRELQALLSCADIEVTKLPQSGEWPPVT